MQHSNKPPIRRTSFHTSQRVCQENTYTNGRKCENDSAFPMTLPAVSPLLTDCGNCRRPVFKYMESKHFQVVRRKCNCRGIRSSGGHDFQCLKSHSKSDCWLTRCSQRKIWFSDEKTWKTWKPGKAKSMYHVVNNTWLFLWRWHWYSCKVRWWPVVIQDWDGAAFC